jgi:hypothetical protein
MSTLDGFDEYRLEQVSLREFDLHLVSSRQDRKRLTKEATEVLKELYGKEARVSVIYEEALSPEDSGKYAIAKALFPIDIEGYLDERFVPEKNEA